MHSFEERSQALSEILNMAGKIARYSLQTPVYQEAWQHLQFCIRHGYVGSPKSKSQFLAHGYLQPGRPDSPPSAEESRRALGVIVCFSDEEMPCNPLRKMLANGTEVIQSAYVSPREHILVVGYIDWQSRVDSALKLLHEARHARNDFGGEFENLPPLDPAELHESRTWKFELDLIDGVNDQAWRRAVETEIHWLINHYAQKSHCPGDAYFAISGQSHMGLDQLFGRPPTTWAYNQRRLLVAMRANFQLAENSPALDLDTAYANIIGAYYKWCESQ